MQVPGFYDDVVPLTDAERRQFRELPFDEAAFMQQLGVDGLDGRSRLHDARTPLGPADVRHQRPVERLQGEGAKTVLPARASAKFSFRLVPNQDPQQDRRVARTDAARRWCRRASTMELIDITERRASSCRWRARTWPRRPRRSSEAFAAKPVFIREGGSIPVVGTFHDQLGVDTLLLGWGLNDDNTHSPNEKFNLADFHRGINASAYLWAELAKTRGDCPLAEEAGLGLS